MDYWKTKTVPCYNGAELFWDEGYPDKPTITTKKSGHGLFIVYPSGTIIKLQAPCYGNTKELGLPMFPNDPHPNHVVAFACYHGLDINRQAFECMAEQPDTIKHDRLIQQHPRCLLGKNRREQVQPFIEDCFYNQQLYGTDQGT
jgi:hypothetical protein